MLKMILALLNHQGRLTWTVSVDSTTIRANQAAAGAGSRAVPGEPADHALGRSRGGWTTKVHLAADTDQTVMSMQITAGQRGDSPHLGDPDIVKGWELLGIIGRPPRAWRAPQRRLQKVEQRRKTSTSVEVFRGDYAAWFGRPTAYTTRPAHTRLA